MAARCSSCRVVVPGTSSLTYATCAACTTAVERRVLARRRSQSCATGCGRRVGGDWKVCHECRIAIARSRAQREGGRTAAYRPLTIKTESLALADPGREARIALYAERAAARLPLFARTPTTVEAA